MQMNLLDCFEQTVGSHGNRTAVRHREESISFEELKTRAQTVGMLLIEKLQGVRNRPVAVFLPKEINIIAADLGILYAACPFMNLDIKTPVERIRKILNQVEPVLILTCKKYAGRLEDAGIPILFMEDICQDTAADGQMLAEHRSGQIDTDPFCLINTSGSTGTPKSVVLNQRSFFDFMNVSRDYFKFDGLEILGSLSPVVFDIFDFELCMLMLYGSQLVLLDAFLASFPVRLLETVAAEKVSFLFWVPSIMVNISNMQLLDRIALPDLKLVWFAGEVFPTKHFLYWYDRLPQTRFANLYGPIEITLDCTFYDVKERPAENEPLPIGIPYRNTDVLILNEEKRQCIVGEEGEICIRGTSLAMGYYNDPKKTAEAFIQNPLNHAYPECIYCTGDLAYMREDGNIIFKGRRDSLIKHMGYRIDLGEIEHVIENKLKVAKYCCAVYRFSTKEIILYYEKEHEITDKDFRILLGRVFPAYMIPSVFKRMDLLPRNTNGKIDRLLLKNWADEGERPMS